MTRIPPPRYGIDIRARLRGFDFDELEQDTHSIFALCADLKFLYFNPAWFRFAGENGGDDVTSSRFGLGGSFAEALPASVREFYLDAYRSVLTTNEVWNHDYECSSWDRFRLYHQAVYPFHDGEGLLVINSLRHEHYPISDLRRPHGPDRGIYVSPDTGLVTQCCNCRRVQREAAPDQWDWVPAWVESMPAFITSGLCSICHQYFWRNQRPQTIGDQP
jgi:hypothetical protein